MGLSVVIVILSCLPYRRAGQPFGDHALPPPVEWKEPCDGRRQQVERQWYPDDRQEETHDRQMVVDAARLKAEPARDHQGQAAAHGQAGFVDEGEDGEIIAWIIMPRPQMPVIGHIGQQRRLCRRRPRRAQRRDGKHTDQQGKGIGPRRDEEHRQIGRRDQQTAQRIDAMLVDDPAQPHPAQPAQH
jgi:hypothetical protein